MCIPRRRCRFELYEYYSWARLNTVHHLGRLEFVQHAKLLKYLIQQRTVC